MSSDQRAVLLARRSVLRIKPYEPGKPIEEVQRELGIGDVIKLASNENPLGPSPRAIEAVSRAGTQLHMYPDGHCYELRKALSARLGVPGECILFGCGSDETIRLIAESFVEPGDEVVFGTSTFSQYEFVTRIAGGKCVPVPMPSARLDLDAVRRAITPRTKLVFIANPNNPTGLIISRGRLTDFITSVPDHVVVVADEAYFEYVESSDYPDSINEYVKNGLNVVALRTFSKMYALAGLRLGYAVARSDLIAVMERVRPPFNVTSLAQVAALAALEDVDHVRRSREINAVGKRLLYSRLDALGVECLPTEANFLLVHVRRPSREVSDQLLRMGVIVRPADIFGLDGWLRVTIGTPVQNERFLAALAACLER